MATGTRPTRGAAVCFLAATGTESSRVFETAVRRAADALGLPSVIAPGGGHRSVLGGGVGRLVRDARLVIADLSGQPPLVFYGLGLAVASGKPVVAITRDAAAVLPIEVAELRTFSYEPSDAGLAHLGASLTRAVRAHVAVGPTATGGEEAAPPPRGADEAMALARDALTRCQLEQAEAHLRRAASVLRHTGPASALLETVATLGVTVVRRGRFEEALPYVQEAVAIARAEGDEAHELAAVANMASVYQGLGDISRAIELNRDVSAAADVEAYPRVSAAALNNLGQLYHRLGRDEEAAACLERALVLYRDLTDAGGEAHVLANLAAVHLAAGESARAEADWSAALRLLWREGDVVGAVRVLSSLAAARLGAADVVAAKRYAKDALELASETGDAAGRAIALGAAANVLLRLGRPAGALELLVEAANLAEGSGAGDLLIGTLRLLAAALRIAGEHHRSARVVQVALLRAREVGHPLARELEHSWQEACTDAPTR